jgi:hypothetical protein
MEDKMKKLLFVLVILGILFTFGCSSSNVESSPQVPEQGALPDEEGSISGAENDLVNEGTSIAGICLGDSKTQVLEILGDKHKEEKFEDDGFFGEGYAIWQYEGIDVVIGLESQKVLQIDVYAPGFTTNLGDKVGDNAASVLEKYRSRYQEYVGANSDGKLTGWFQTDEDTLLIFSFNKVRSRFNEEVTADSKVEAITLGYTYFFH